MPTTTQALRGARLASAAITAAAIACAATRVGDGRWIAIAGALVFGSAALVLQPVRRRHTAPRQMDSGVVVIPISRSLRVRIATAGACWSLAAGVLASTGVLPLAVAVPIAAAAATVAMLGFIGAAVVPPWVAMTSSTLFVPGVLHLVPVSWHEVGRVTRARALATPVIGIEARTASRSVHRHLTGHDWTVPEPRVAGGPGGLARVLNRMASDPWARVELDGADAADAVAAMLGAAIDS